MKVYIKESGEFKNLEFIDPRTGVNNAQDLIGNYGALDDGQFEYDSELESYTCTGETFDWWNKVLTDLEAAEERILEVKEEYPEYVEQIDEVTQAATDTDLEYHAAAINSALNEFIESVK